MTNPPAMHVLILNQTFYPDHAATAQHMWDLARHLDRAGHRVTVVTGRYYYGTDKPFERAYERIGNIEIHRVRGTGFGKKHFAGRLADFASFYLAAAWRMIRQEQPDVTLALTSPPMIAGLAMVQRQVASAPSGRPVRFVYHIMDLYPDAAVASGVFAPRSLVTRGLHAVTSATLRSADAVLALGRDMRDTLVRDYRMDGRAAGRIHVVTPWAPEDLLHPLAKADNPLVAKLGMDRTFNVVYSGNFGIAHDVDTIVSAIDATRDDAGLNWVFIGSGKRYEPLKQRAEASGWRHVRFLPFQDQSELNRSLNLADVHLVSQLPAFTGIVVPSKLFGIMAVGRPAVMVGPADAEVSRILAESDSGIVVANGDSAGLVSAIRRLRQDDALRARLGSNARAEFLAHYTTTICCQRIETILRDVVAAR